MVLVCLLCELVMFGFWFGYLSRGISESFFSSFHLLSMICIRYLMANWEKDFISFWMSHVVILNSLRDLVV